MKLRLVKATEDDFEELREFITTTGYHWMFSTLTMEEKRERLHIVRFPPRPQYGRERYVTASERYASYSKNDYVRWYMAKDDGKEMYKIYDSKKIIGYVFIRNVKNKKRIVDFPLDLDYQNVETIQSVVNTLKRKVKKELFIMTVFPFAYELIKNVEGLEIGPRTG